jgi:molybdopterin converting factor small subunit
MATVFIPTPLRQFVDGQDAVQADGATVDEVLASLVERHTALKNQLFDDQDRLRRFVNIYVNDEDIRYLQRGDTVVQDTDEVSVVPAIAGGAD